MPRFVTRLAFSAASLAVLASCAGGVSSCSGHREAFLSAQALQSISSTLSPSQQAPNAVRVYLDVSGSMRGFALAARANQRDAGTPYYSILFALRAISKLAKEPTPEKPAPGAGRPVVACKTFGARLSDPIALDGLVDGAMAAGNDLVASTPGLGRSANCDTGPKWIGSPADRDKIDGSYSDDITCMNPVFEDILAESPGQLNLIVTDAEQNASASDARCPSPKNVGSIQSLLNRWAELGGYAALISVQLPYQPWQTPGAANYCNCRERLLYVYILTSSADSAEAVFLHFADNWRSGGIAPTYIPLSPRPAVAFRFVAAILPQAASPRMIFDQQAPAAELDPQPGKLPIVSVELKQEDATLELDPAEMAWPSVKGAQTDVLDWARGQFEWLDPVPLDKDGHIDRSAPGQPVSLIRISPSSDSQGDTKEPSQDAWSRSLQFLGRAAEFPKPQRPHLQKLALKIRRAVSTSEHGCRWFLLEVTAPPQAHIDRVLAALTGASQSSCTSRESLASQVRFLFGRGAAARVLLHVEY